jgi:REP element-mobilizing transposase RayT
MARARARKKHVQVDFVFSKRGGKRKGSGRPARHSRSSERHKTREPLRDNQPVHVTLRLERDIGTLRRLDMYRACRKALVTVLGRDAFRIVHISLQDGHLHLMVEADDERALAKGMQAFEISAARHINQAMTKRCRRVRRGRVFSDRYHARAITTPLAARHALAYVINNWRRHGKDRDIDLMFLDVDPFSSGASFLGWKERDARIDRGETLDGEPPLVVSPPQTWLLSNGWTKYGPISVHEVPGPKAQRLVA